MQILQLLSIVLPLVCLLGQDVEAGKPGAVSSVSCAALYLDCLEKDSATGVPPIHLSRDCKKKIKGLDTCKPTRVEEDRDYARAKYEQYGYKYEK